MRVESVDEVEIIRRMKEGVYDEKEYQKALAWIKAKCNPDFDKNPENMQRTKEEKEKDWEFTAKMACIIKDLMNGNPNLPEGAEEEMVGNDGKGHRRLYESDDVTIRRFGLFPQRRVFLPFRNESGNVLYDDKTKYGQRSWSRYANCRGLDGIRSRRSNG